jgi:hypothetical protein
MEATNGRVIKTRESVRHTFSDAEVLELSRSMARTQQELAGVEDEAKEVKKQFEAQLQQKRSEINRLSHLINNGYEYRTCDCELRYHSPEQGMKTLIRLDTGEEVKCTKMDPREMQDVLFEEVDLSNVMDTVAEQINGGALGDGVTAKVSKRSRGANA